MDATVVNDVGVVVIGRNEGARLVRCLTSIGSNHHTVYVDSGSDDGSVGAARALGVQVVELDMAIPFTAARARNAGRAALRADVQFVQFVDGDCVVRPDWLGRAVATLEGDGTLGAVFGRLREIAPEASRYNWLCDVEWAVPPGPAFFFGGNVMLRASALDDAGGYPAEMIAGEEPDLAIRMRARGWSIICLPEEMMLHDAAIMRFGQWWRRTERSGHAYAELASRHSVKSVRDYPRRLAGVFFWSVAVPLLAIVAAAATGPIAGLVVLALPLVQGARLALRELRQRPLGEAMTLATFLMLAKPAQAIGAMRFWLTRSRGRTSRLIEYKTAA